jgi:hypothetical protein
MNNEINTAQGEFAQLLEAVRRLERNVALMMIITCFIGVLLLAAMALMLSGRPKQDAKSSFPQKATVWEPIQVSTYVSDDLRAVAADAGRAVRILDSANPSVVRAEICVLPDLSVRARLFNAPVGSEGAGRIESELIIAEPAVKTLDVLNEDGALRPVLGSEYKGTHSISNMDNSDSKETADYALTWVCLVDSAGNVRAEMQLTDGEAFNIGGRVWRADKIGLAFYDEEGKRIWSLGDWPPVMG